jgi:hypothetical protein
MKKNSLFLLFALAMICGGCDVIAESDRLLETDKGVYVKKSYYWTLPIRPVRIVPKPEPKWRC